MDLSLKKGVDMKQQWTSVNLDIKYLKQNTYQWSKEKILYKDYYQFYNDSPTTKKPQRLIIQMMERLNKLLPI